MSRKKKAEEPAEVKPLEAEPVEEADDAEGTPQPEEKTEPVVYIGPDIKHIAVKGTVYSNGLPVKLTQKIEEIPAIKGLIVPVSALADARRLRDTEGTALYNLYRTVKEKL